MIVTARAVDGQAQEGGGDPRNHVVAVEVQGDLLAFGAIDLLGQRALVERPGGDETEGGDLLGLIREEDVGRDLFLNESGVRNITIEGVDEVVAIRPGVLSRTVHAKPVTLAEVRDVEPEPREPLAELRGGEEAVHQDFIGVGGLVIDECVDLLGAGRQAVEVEGEAADQRPTVGLGGGSGV